MMARNTGFKGHNLGGQISTVGNTGQCKHLGNVGNKSGADI